MSQLGWIDFSPTHRNKVMLVMDMFKEQGVIDELGLGTIRDTISDLLFPGTSTIQTRAKYLLLIPWIVQDIEQRGKNDRFLSELEESEINFIKVLRLKPNSAGIIGGTLKNANPKRKPSTIYWNGLKRYGILKFKGSINDYKNYLKYAEKKKRIQNRQVIESDDKITGDDKDANHLYQHHLWCQLPKPPNDWKTNLSIELSIEEAKFLKEKIVRSNPGSLWSNALTYSPETAATFSDIADFLSIEEIPGKLKELIKLAVDFNTIMQGAVIRYNFLIQSDRENGRIKELQPIWENYWEIIQKFDWQNWDNDLIWKYCPFIQLPTKRFVEKWISFVQKDFYDETTADQLIKDRELKLKGIRRARLHDKAVAQKQASLTGINIVDGNVYYLNYRWNTARNFLIDILNGLKQDAATQ